MRSKKAIKQKEKKKTRERENDKHKQNSKEERLLGLTNIILCYTLIRISLQKPLIP